MVGWSDWAFDRPAFLPLLPASAVGSCHTGCQPLMQAVIVSKVSTTPEVCQLRFCTGAMLAAATLPSSTGRELLP